MKFLWISTLIWAFSFNLIGNCLTGVVDVYFSASARNLLAFLIFLPFMRLKKINQKLALKLMTAGAAQLGFMFIFLYISFSHLQVAEVLMYTIFTPIYVSLLNDLFDQKFRSKFFLTSFISVIGAGVIKYTMMQENFLSGFLIVQLSNFCFAFGQVYYKRIALDEKNKNLSELKHHEIIGWFYSGAVIVSATAFFILGDMAKIPQNQTQWFALLWLGIAASGIGYYLWNRGVTLVDNGTMAIMNNALIPAGLVINFFFNKGEINYSRLIAGAALIIISLALNNYFVSLKK